MKTITEMTKLEILNHLVQLETMYQAVKPSKLCDNWTENYVDDCASLEAELFARSPLGDDLMCTYSKIDPKNPDLDIEVADKIQTKLVAIAKVLRSNESLVPTI